MTKHVLAVKKKSGCQCGRQNPYKCVSCDNLYLCVDTINGKIIIIVIVIGVYIQFTFIRYCGQITFYRGVSF